MFAAHYGLSNLCVFLDRNRLQIDGSTETVMSSEPLDVYKRQVLFGMPPMFPIAVSMAFELAAYGLVSGLVWRRVKPVSYTHLDVYKRQARGWPACRARPGSASRRPPRRGCSRRRPAPG